MGARHRVGIRLLYRPAMLNRLAEFIPWNRFLGSINVKKYGLRLHRLAGRYDYPMPELTLSPTVRGLEFSHCTILRRYGFESTGLLLFGKLNNLLPPCSLHPHFLLPHVEPKSKRMQKATTIFILIFGERKRTLPYKKGKLTN
jgi:hypothetical protein